MFLARRFSSVLKCTQKYYSKIADLSASKEIVKNVDPFANIKVNCGANVTIIPYDLLDCPDSNTLRARISSDSEKYSANFKLNVIDSKNVEIYDNNPDLMSEKVKCVLEVPVKANLEITSHTVNIAEMYSDHIHVIANENIETKNLRSTSIYLESVNGNITCKGITLAHKIDIHTNDGNIDLDKLQGDLMHCKTLGGTISTNSSYVDTAKFVTESGALNLRNVHKHSEVYVMQEANVEMIGIHGNVYMKTNGGNLNLHFSEIFDDNIIVANDSENVQINISDNVEKNCFIEIHSDKVVLENSASHLVKYLQSEKHFCLGNEEDFVNKLLICTKGLLKLGKMSWADSLKAIVGANDL